MGVTPAAGLTNVHLGEPDCTTNGLQTSALLFLPVEIRLQIYAALFGAGKVVLDGGDHQNTSCFVSRTAAPITTAEGRSSQLLRTCKAILFEARPVLYANTVFQVIQHAFAASLPSSFTDDHPSAQHICAVIWQVDCDILKRWYKDDLQFQRVADWASLRSLEIRCRVDAWRGSYCGHVDDRANFATGRDQVLNYGAGLLHGMGAVDVKTFDRLVEDRRFHGKGEMRIKLSKSRAWLSPDDVVLEELQS